MTTAIEEAVRNLGSGQLTEDSLRQHIWPLFSRVLERQSKEIYLANHSLGQPLDRTAEDIQTALNYWYEDMDGAWDNWLAERDHFRATIARLINLPRPDAVIPKDNVGQAVRAVINALPARCPKILTTQGEFDSTDFILKVYEQQGRCSPSFVPPNDSGLFDAESIANAITPETGLVIVSAVFFHTGQVLEHLDTIITRAHDAGVLVLVDAYHAAGVMPIDAHRLNADFIVGGSYKYTRGGPGACWLAIRPDHLYTQRFTPIDTGWFAKRNTFAYERPDSPEFAEGGNAWLESTPAVLPYYQAKAGLELTLALGIERLRSYNLEQQQFLADRLREHRVDTRLIDPRGAFLLVPADNAAQKCSNLRENGVNTDSRWGCIRLCPDILNTQDEMSRAAKIIQSAMTR
ncbi:MAG: aminotransferase class V-fold PLP-dependent enzyme [Planctomycetota bacterium]